MATTLEKVGSRLYFANCSYEQSMRIKERLGAKWDADRRQRWVGLARREAAEALVAELNGGVMAATEGSRAVAGSVGLSGDAPAAVVADKLQDAGRDDEAGRVRSGGTAQRDPKDVRLTGKGTYQGRTYFLGSYTQDRRRVLILQLPKDDGSYFERWVDASQVTVTKTYQPRQQWDGRRYSGREVTVYTTLGSIARFVEKQKRLTPEQREEQDVRRSVSACGRRDCRRLSGMFCTDCHDEE